MEGLFGGTWYRGAVKMKGDTIVPLPPFETYNPFDLYYSASDVRQGQRSLYFEFLSVNSDKPNEVLNFCQRFGVLGSEYIHVSKPIPTDNLVLAFAESLKLISRKARTAILAEKAGTSKLWIQVTEHINTLITQEPGKRQEVEELFGRIHRDSSKPNQTAICLPMSINEFKMAQSELGREAGLDLDLSKPTLQSQKDHIIGSINYHLFLSSVRPYLQWDIQQGRPKLNWESHSLLGLLWLMAMIDFLGPGKNLTCPRCSALFITTSNRVTYCSSSCYENHKVQKYQRKKKDEKLAAQKGKKLKNKKSTEKKREGDTHGTKRRKR